jgi:hypothetical protein
MPAGSHSDTCMLVQRKLESKHANHYTSHPPRDNMQTDDFGMISGELRALIAELESSARGGQPMDRGPIATALDGM